MSTVFLDGFSSDVIDLKRGQRTVENVLAVLAKNPCISTWDMSEHRWLSEIIHDMNIEGLIEPMNEPYPWHRYALTDSGKARLL